MDAAEKHALDSNMRFLQSNVVLTEEMYGGLIEKQVLSWDMMDKIKSKSTQGGQVLSLIQYMKKRGKLAFSHFLQTLHDTDQGHVAERLEIYAQNQRQGSDHVLTKEKMKKFIHKNFIHNRHFALEDERLLLSHLVLKEDWEDEKKKKEDALDNQAKLEVELKDKDRELNDLNRRLKNALAAHNKQLVKINDLELEKMELAEKIRELEEHMKSPISAFVEGEKKDEADGAAVPEPMRLHSCTESEASATSDRDELLQIQTEELDYTRKQLDILKERTRMSNCKLGGLVDKVKVFLQETCNMEAEQKSYNTQLQKLEAHIDILMNQMKGMATQAKENQSRRSHSSAEVQNPILTRQGSVINLKDKLSETRKQKHELKKELQSVQHRLKSITDELEHEKIRVKRLEADLQSREPSRQSDHSSRAKTPVNVQFPVIDTRMERQKTMSLWNSMPGSVMSSLMNSSNTNTGSPIGQPKITLTNHKPKEELSLTISRAPQGSPRRLGRMQVQCARCNTVYGLADEKGVQSCRFHPSDYTCNPDGTGPKWSCCGQIRHNAPGCRAGNHIARH